MRTVHIGLIDTILKAIRCCSLVLVAAGIYGHSAEAQQIITINEGSEWHYFKGQGRPPAYWNHVSFDDAQWEKGLTGIGYGKPEVKTHLSDMMGSYRRVYARKRLNIGNPGKVRRITLSLTCDGAFIAYINGIEVLRNRTAPAEELDIGGFSHELLPGTNVLSVECENDDISSEDFLFIPAFEIHIQ